MLGGGLFSVENSVLSAFSRHFSRASSLLEENWPCVAGPWGLGVDVEAGWGGPCGSPSPSWLSSRDIAWECVSSLSVWKSSPSDADLVWSWLWLVVLEPMSSEEEEEVSERLP